VHTFTATLNTSGTQSITATDTLHPSITGTESGIQVAAVPATDSIENGLLDTDDGGGRLDLRPEAGPAAAAVVLGDWPEDLPGNAVHSRLTEALFASSADPADANQDASVSAGVLAALAIPYGPMTRAERKRKRRRESGVRAQPC
jgi:hypothetical protein